MLTNTTILCHPENYKLLQKAIPKENDDFMARVWGQSPLLQGISITTNENVPKFGRKWQFPQEKFITYEDKDREWCIPLGIGRWVDDPTQPLFVQMQEPDWLKPLPLGEN